ncbi:MAG: peptidylprolyl isomerase [Planctomycetota bacterium]|jgi:parvulin-like peptidyl-prolyl isomerase
MKRQDWVIAVLCLAVVVVLAGCGNKNQGKFTDEEMAMIPLANKYALPDASGGYTLKVYSQTITVDEILQAAEKNMKPMAAQLGRDAFRVQSQDYFRQAVRGKTVDILLYEEARKQAPDNIDDMLEKGVESEIARFVAGYNNNYALAEKAIKEMGMDWKSFREYQKKLIMTQSYISDALTAEKRFSNQELLDYYESVRKEYFTQVGIIEFSLIDMMADKLTDKQIAPGEDKQQAAERICKEITSQLENGEDFAALASKYSYTMRASGGRWTPHTIGSGSLPKPYDIVEEWAVTMQPGEIKGPIEVEDHYFVLKLESIQHGRVIPFEQVKKQIEQQLLFQYRNQQYTELVQKLITTADVVRLERFSQSCIEVAYNRWGKDQ